MKRWLVLLFGLLPVAPVLGHDAGISKARMIEESPGAYVLEVDADTLSLPDFRDPILPLRCEDGSPAELERAGNYALIRYRFACAEAPLESADLLILPWSRAGVLLTVQWHDGEVRQALFLRGPEGIRIPVRELNREAESLSVVARGHFARGLLHAASGSTHILLAVAVALLGDGRRSYQLFAAYASGQAAAMVLTDLGLHGPPLGIADLLVVLAVLVTARGVFKQASALQTYALPLVAAGVLHGLGYANLVADTGVASRQLLPALLTFNLGVDAIQFGIVTLVVFVSAMTRNIRRYDRIRAAAALAGGALAVAAGLQMFGDLTFRIDDRGRPLPAIDALVNGSQIGGRPTAGSPRSALTSGQPFATYVTIEPFEIRHEVLFRVSALRHWGHLGLDVGSVIAPTDQPPLIERVLALIDSATQLTIDGATAVPVLEQGGFVTVGRSGVQSRERPVPETSAEAFIAASRVFEHGGLPDEVVLEWDLFPAAATDVTATVIDPFGGRQSLLTPDEPTLRWRKRLSGFKVAEIQPVGVSEPRIPLVSIALLAAAALALLSAVRPWPAPRRVFGTGCLAAAIVLYPFARIPTDLPYLGARKPSPEEAGPILDALLTNVYRSFDLRGDEAVYDRLSLSVTGDQLTEVYLQNRLALELENRGGARGRIDEVEILEIRSVDAQSDDSYTIDAVWKVSGSVNHFGHTHHRQNHNHARVSIVPADGAWKIHRIDIIDEQRIL